MSTRTDWTAPCWEAVAAEQLLLAPTLLKRNADRTIRIARSPHGGRRRLKHPETGAGLLTTGDVGPVRPPQGAAAPLRRCLARRPVSRRRHAVDLGWHGRDAGRPKPLSRMILILG